MDNIDKINKIISKLKVKRQGNSWWVIIEGLNARRPSGGKIKRFYICECPSRKTRKEKLDIFRDKLLNGEYTPVTQNGRQKLVLEVSGKFNLVSVDTQTEEERLTQVEETQHTEGEKKNETGSFGCY